MYLMWDILDSNADAPVGIPTPASSGGASGPVTIWKLYWGGGSMMWDILDSNQ